MRLINNKNNVIVTFLRYYHINVLSLNLASIYILYTLISFLMKVEKTALMVAAQGGHLEIVNTLIEAGADVNLRDEVCRNMYLIRDLCNYYISCGTSA